MSQNYLSIFVTELLQITLQAKALYNLMNFCLLYVMRCAIFYHLYNLKNKKITHGGVLLLVKLQALAHLLACFSRFLDCTNGTESPNASHIVSKI